MRRQPAWSLLVLLPLAGSGLFLLLFGVATQLYPGGSSAHPAAVGFSWRHNYWCNLLNERALSGQPNRAQPVALLAMLMLCASLALFWYVLPGLFPRQRRTGRLIRWSGICAMSSALYISTAFHDLAINVASLFGLVALLALFRALYADRRPGLLGAGVGCLLLMSLNSAIYYSGYWLTYLPVVQKITFVLVLGWFAWLTLVLHRHHRSEAVGNQTGC